MMLRVMAAPVTSLILCLGALAGYAQPASELSAHVQGGSSEELKFVVMISRHGVRSPTGKIDQLNRFSAQPWPAWSVAPGFLTPHGATLMKLFGAYDRILLASQGVLSAEGCGDAARVSIVADSDQRTRETGKALAAGLFPGCPVEIQALAEGVYDPLFHTNFAEGMHHANKQVASAAIAGRIGNHPEQLAVAYRPQLLAMEEVLTGCSQAEACAAQGRIAKQSLFDMPSSIAPGTGDHLVELHSPLGTAATMAENLLLEYTEGMDSAQVGWGRVDQDKLRELMQIHTANADIERRTEYIASAQSSNLLLHIVNSMQQSIAHKSVKEALGKPGDRLAIVVGHDTNLTNISGALGLSWLIDGRLDDTPPGGALVFELWKKHDAEEYSVRTFYTAQTLNQMRSAAPLDFANPPERVAVFVPGCSRADSSCAWSDFRAALMHAFELGYRR